MHLEPRRKRELTRRALLAGGIAGGVLSVVISVLMDFMVSDSLQGTWRDAIVNDLERFMSISLSPDSFITYILFVLVLLLLAVIGAAIGAVFAYIVFRFLEILSS